MKPITFLLMLLCAFSFQGISQTQNYWVKKNNFGGLKRERAIAFSIGDFGYVGMGVDTAEIVHKDLWQYDPTTDSWSQKAELPSHPRRNAVTFTLNNLAYVGTGMDSAEASTGHALADFWAYNPDNNTWIQKTDFPGSGGTGLYFGTGFSTETNGYLACGKRGPNDYTAELWQYTPTNDTWTQKSDFPGGVRHQLTSFVIDNLAYVGLGIDQDVYRKDIWMYNETDDTWTEKNDFLGEERGAVVSFKIQQRGFICMGTNGGIKKDLWEYNPFEDSWTVRANYEGSERKNAVAFVIGDSAFVGTGKGVSGKKSSMYVYNPVNVLSINESTPNLTFNIYPNPTSEFIYIKKGDKSFNQINIYNLNGQLLYTDFIWLQSKKIELKSFEKGTYIINVVNTDQTTNSQQFIIQ